MENYAGQLAAISAEIGEIKFELQAAEQKFADAKKEVDDAEKVIAEATKELKKAVTKKDLQKYTTLYNGSVVQLQVVGIQLQVVGIQLQVVGVQLKSLQDKELKLIDVEQLRIRLAHSDLQSNFPLVREASVLSQSSIYGHEVKMKALEYYGLKGCAVDGYVCQLTGVAREKYHIICSHIYQRSWESARIGPQDTKTAFEFLGGTDINEARNILFLLKDIESNWDCGRLNFIWNDDQEKYQCIILDEGLLGKNIRESGGLSFGDLNSKFLNFLQNAPSRNLMAFRSKVNQRMSTHRSGYSSYHWKDGQISPTVGLSKEEEEYVLDWIFKLTFREKLN